MFTPHHSQSPASKFQKTAFTVGLWLIVGYRGGRTKGMVAQACVHGGGTSEGDLTFVRVAR